MKLKKGMLKNLLVYFKINSIAALDAIFVYRRMVKLIFKSMHPPRGVT